MPCARTSMRGLDLNCRLAVKGIQKASSCSRVRARGAGCSGRAFMGELRRDGGNIIGKVDRGGDTYRNNRPARRFPMTASSSSTDWRARAAALRPREALFIDGAFRPAAAGATFDKLSPVDGRLLARVAAGEAADVDAAVQAARRAFERGDWARCPPRERKAVLLRFAESIRAHRDELALTETLDMGKPIADSLSVDVPSTANCIQWFAESIDKVYGEVAPTAADTLALVT